MMRTWLRLVLRELALIASDRRIYTIMLGGPFFYGLIFGGVYCQGRARAVPIVVVDQDHSQYSRGLIQALSSSDSLKISGFGESETDFTEAVKQGSAYACVMIPPAFERHLKRGRQGNVLVLVDGSNILIANTATRALRTVLATFRLQARAQHLLLGGVPRRSLEGRLFPIQAVYRTLFNPAYNYSTFLLMGLVCVALQQVTLLAVSITLGVDRENGGAAALARITNSPLQIMLGKMSAHLLVMLPLSLLAVTLPFSLFHTVFHGSYALVLSITALFVILQVAAAYGFAGLCRDTLFTTQLLLCLSVPAFMLSGFTWPVYAMPAWLHPIAYALPLTHYADLVRKVSLMSATPADVHLQILVIAVWVPLALAWGYWGMRRCVKSER